MRLYNKKFAVNLVKTTQTVSLQRGNYNIKMCFNSSEINIIFSSANTVSFKYTRMFPIQRKVNGVIPGGYVHFVSFISLLYMNSGCLFVLFFTVTYVTTLLQVLTEDVISLVLSLVYKMILKKGQNYDDFFPYSSYFLVSSRRFGKVM